MKENREQQREEVKQLEIDKSFSAVINYLETNKSCHNCSCQVTDSADICENCGEWLLIGQCCFCYTPFSSEQAFCGECGNPPLGISCSKCNTTSIFDFCVQCMQPLTEQAEQTFELFENSPDILEILLVKSQLDKGNDPIENQDESINENQKRNWQRNWQNFNQQIDNQIANRLSKKRVSPQNQNRSYNTNLSEIQNRLEIADRIKMNEDQKLSEAEFSEREKLIRDKISTLQNQFFANNQEARRTINTLKLLIPKLLPKTKKVMGKVLGWRCNFTQTLHEPGPQDCAEPKHGGTWIFEDKIINDGYDIIIETK